MGRGVGRKAEEAWNFLVPEGRFSGGQEGDSWWDENNFQKLAKPSKMGICELIFCLVVLFWY